MAACACWQGDERPHEQYPFASPSTHAFHWEFKTGTTSNIFPPTQLPTGKHLRRFSFPLSLLFLLCTLIQGLIFQLVPSTCSVSHCLKVTFGITFWLSDFWTSWWGKARFTDTLSPYCNTEGTLPLVEIQSAVPCGLTDIPGHICAAGNTLLQVARLLQIVHWPWR